MVRGTAFKVLFCFRESNTRSFVELCEQAGYPTDLGGYYIRQLIGGGYLVKQDRGLYVVTPKGKQQIALSFDQKPTVQRPRIAVVLVAEQAGKVVVNRRTAQPFIGFAEWPARSVLHGDSLQDAACMAAKQRLGVDSAPKLVGFFRRIDRYEQIVFDDKLFAVHHLVVPGDVQLHVSEPKSGTLELYTKEDLRTIQKPARSLLHIFDFVTAGGGIYNAHSYKLGSEDLEE
ncbi:MAG TPA: hypothetical protein VLF43_04070 [Candidatus Saccharimonadales bacterium]|nr:hypothetical protein [Candidatus Saccharimonadales bacterium]